MSFDEANDLVRFVQNRTGELDSNVIYSYWLEKSTCLETDLHLQSTSNTNVSVNLCVGQNVGRTR